MFKGLSVLVDRRISLKFLVSTGVAVALTVGMVFLWFSKQQEKLIREQLEKQAVILHKQIVLTRQWASDHQSVFVPHQGSEADSRPQQEIIRAEDGTVFQRISPAVLTKQLSERAARGDLYSFRITNSSQLNPENAPDEFEAKALELFQAGKKDGIFRTEDIDGKAILRYAAPIEVKESCLQCHANQGFAQGSVGGCLSVFIPMDNALATTSRNQSILFGVGAAMGGSLVLLMFLAARSLVFKRIAEIKRGMNLMRSTDIADLPKGHGDELKEIADFCLMFNYKMDNYHHELERKIREATQDLSETNKNLESANKKLMLLNKAKSDFFSDISHELRTPLTSIKGAVDLMSRKASDGDPVYLDIISRNTDHLMRAVLDFLDYSKIESGQIDLNFREGSLSSVARDAILSQKLEAQAKSLNVLMDAPYDLVLKFDQHRLYQVMANLLSNAVRFSPDEGTVRLQISQDDGFAQVSVSDEGPGIDPKYHTAIFEKFFQVFEDQERMIHRGTSGIGLAICKSIVEAHGGRIWVDSEPGKGSRFVFRIPVRG